MKVARSLKSVGFVLFLGWVLAAPGGAASPVPENPPRPNILLINLDDARADGLAFMPVVQSRLVDEGLSFTRAFTPNPVCGPSRASLYTGLHSHHHHVLANFPKKGLPPGARHFIEKGAEQTIAVWLRDAGYRTGFFGKYINWYQRSDGVPPGWDRWWAFYLPNYKQYPVIQDDAPAKVSFYKEYSTDKSAELIRDFVREASLGDAPWFVAWNPYAPHVAPPSPYPIPAKRHEGAFDSLEPWRPPSWNEPDVSDKPAWVRNLAVDSEDIETTDGIRKRGIEALLSVDEQIGALLDLFVELGIDRDTLVLLTSDNGAAWGEHRYFLQAKHCPYEECMHVPMIVRYPRTIPEKKVIGSVAVLNLDIAPTLAALAGATIPVPIDGVSFHSWIVGEKSSSARTDFLMEGWQAPEYFGVRDIAGKTSYIEYGTGEKELYDLTVDPYQLTNVVDDPQYAAVRMRAAKRLAELLPSWLTAKKP